MSIWPNNLIGVFSSSSLNTINLLHTRGQSKPRPLSIGLLKCTIAMNNGFVDFSKVFEVQFLKNNNNSTLGFITSS